MQVKSTFFAILLFALPAVSPLVAVAQAERVISTESVLDDPYVRDAAKKGLDELYNLRFEQALEHFQSIDRRYPKHPIGPFLESLSTWWKILLDLSDQSHDREFYVAMDEVIKRCNKALKKNPQDVDALFFKGAALGFRGRLRSNRGDWFKSATDGKKAMDYVLAVPELVPDNSDYVFGKGIYDYFAAVVPEEYPYVKPVMSFFPSGDRDRGLSLIQQTAAEGYFIKTEAVYFLLQIYFLFEKDYNKCVEYATWLTSQYPGNAYFKAIEGRVYAHWGRWTQSREVFESVLESYRAGENGYTSSAAEQALYYLGRERMVRRDYNAASAYFSELATITDRVRDDTYFKVLGVLRQAMVDDARGYRERAVKGYKKVLKMKDWSGAHERAERYLEQAYG